MPLRISHATEQGLRPYQEDRLVIRQIDDAGSKGFLLAVADGHGGDATSSFVAQELSDGLFEKMLGLVGFAQIDAALRKVFQSLDEATSRLSAERDLHYESGTTLSLVYVCELQQTAHVAVIGDSPVIFCCKDDNIQLSPDHNARTSEKERKEATLRGGRFVDGYITDPFGSRGLQMTRDIGFHAMGNVLNREPEIYNLGISAGDVIILASDGLLDPAHRDRNAMEEDAKRMARLVVEEKAEAEDLVNDAIARQTGDNVTVIVCRC